MGSIFNSMQVINAIRRRLISGRLSVVQKLGLIDLGFLDASKESIHDITLDHWIAQRRKIGTQGPYSPVSSLSRVYNWRNALVGIDTCRG